MESASHITFESKNWLFSNGSSLKSSLDFLNILESILETIWEIDDDWPDAKIFVTIGKFEVVL